MFAFLSMKKSLLDEVANHQNTQVIACDPSKVSPVMLSKNSAYVMIFAAMARDGKVMPPHFIKVGLKSTQQSI